MSYQKQAWRDYDDTKTELQNMNDGAVVTPERMNHMETGIANSAERAELEQTKQEVTAQLAQTTKDLGVNETKKVVTQENLTTAVWRDDNLGDIYGVEQPFITIQDKIEGKHLAFPTITKVGTKLIVFYRVGTEHASFDGEIHKKESTDDGETWGTATVICKATDVDYRDPNVILLPNGHLMLQYFKRSDSGSKRVTEVKRSTDGGNSWGSAIQLPPPIDNPTANYGARGNMAILPNGNILVAIYKMLPYRVYIVESTDNGLTWEFKTYLNPDDVISEVALCYLDGKVYAVARQENNFNKDRLLIYESSDEGNTWSDKRELPLYGHAPSLSVLNGRMILTHRALNVDENKDRKFELNLLMLRNGEIDSTNINLYWSSDHWDYGYPDTFSDANYTYVVYYWKPANGKIVLRKIPTSVLNQATLVSHKHKVEYSSISSSTLTKQVIKPLLYEITVVGDGTNSKEFTVDLPKEYPIRNIQITPWSTVGGAFYATVKTKGVGSFTGVLFHATSNFTTGVRLNIVVWVEDV